MIALKAIVLQIYWYLAVYYGHAWNDIIYLFLTAVLFALNIYFYELKISIKKFFVFIFSFSLFGLLQDNFLMSVNIFRFPEGYYPFWVNSLFIVFLLYYGDIFYKFRNMNFCLLAFIGGLGGAFAYWSGAKLGGMVILADIKIFLASLFISWALFFPISLKLYYRRIKLDFRSV